jgi:hypothetical protein
VLHRFLGRAPSAQRPQKPRAHASAETQLGSCIAQRNEGALDFEKTAGLILPIEDKDELTLAIEAARLTPKRLMPVCMPDHIAGVQPCSFERFSRSHFVRQWQFRHRRNLI